MRKASWHGMFRARCDVPVTLSPRVVQTIPTSQICPAGRRGQFHLILLARIRVRHAPLGLREPFKHFAEVVTFQVEWLSNRNLPEDIEIGPFHANGEKRECLVFLTLTNFC